MGVKSKLLLVGVLVSALAVFVTYTVVNNDVPVLQPQGDIGLQQRDLIVIATYLMLLVVIPVYILTFAIAWRYRASNTKAKYSPRLEGNKMLETLWWGVPLVIISILAVITWYSSHQLDPFKSLSSQTHPVRVQVVALQWKWLFIYPEQKIATVNELWIPTDTPINFEITSDAPMNSFWIPALGGQIYAMSGMSTKLHLIANTDGIYQGSSANISGSGFADMKFTTHAVSNMSFDSWVEKTRVNNETLSLEKYLELAQPRVEKKPRFYGKVTDNLYNTLITKYTDPALQSNITEQHDDGMKDMGY